MLVMMIMLLAMTEILLAQPILVAEIRVAEDNSHICVVHRNGSASIFWRRLAKSYLKLEVEWASNFWIHPGVWVPSQPPLQHPASQGQNSFRRKLRKRTNLTPAAR